MRNLDPRLWIGLSLVAMGLSLGGALAHASLGYWADAFGILLKGTPWVVVWLLANDARDAYSYAQSVVDHPTSRRETP